MTTENLFDFSVRRFFSGQPFTANHVLTYAIRRLDARLRRRQHIFEFCNHPRCLLRVALRRAEANCTLPVRCAARRGACVGELHLWNEHLPPIPADGPNFVWAMSIHRQMRESFALLAESVRADSRLKDVEIFGAKTGLGGGKSHGHFERVMKSFGFEQVEELRRGDWRERLVGVGESLHVWALLHAFNPGALGHRHLNQLSFRQFWMSRKILLEKYPPGSHGLIASQALDGCLAPDLGPMMGISPSASESAPA